MERGLSPDVALPAHDRSFFLFLVASLAVEVEGFHEPRLATGILLGMAVRAAAILRRFVLHEFAVFVHMMALIAVFDPGFLVVRIVGKRGGRPLGSGKGIRGYRLHILLGPCIYDAKDSKDHQCPDDARAWIHAVSSLSMQRAAVRPSGRAALDGHVPAAVAASRFQNFLA
jgi:hypothetical protein